MIPCGSDFVEDACHLRGAVILYTTSPQSSNKHLLGPRKLFFFGAYPHACAHTDPHRISQKHQFPDTEPQHCLIGVGLSSPGTHNSILNHSPSPYGVSSISARVATCGGSVGSFVILRHQSVDVKPTATNDRFHISPIARLIREARVLRVEKQCGLQIIHKYHQPNTYVPSSKHFPKTTRTTHCCA